jgi:hypothetical protein
VAATDLDTCLGWHRLTDTRGDTLTAKDMLAQF